MAVATPSILSKVTFMESPYVYPASIIVSVTCGHFQGSSLEPSV